MFFKFSISIPKVVLYSSTYLIQCGSVPVRIVIQNLLETSRSLHAFMSVGTFNSLKIPNLFKGKCSWVTSNRIFSYSNAVWCMHRGSSTQLIKPNYLVVLATDASPQTLSLKTYTLYSRIESSWVSFLLLFL